MKKLKLSALGFAALATIAFLFSTIDVKAQETAVKTFKVGDRVEVNIANNIVNEDRWVKGTVTQINYTDDGRILSYMVKQDNLSYVTQMGNLARVIRPLADGDGTTETKNVERENQTENRDDSEEATNDGECSFEKYPAVKATDKFSNALIKSVLYERYSFEANTGSLTSPGAIGVVFLNIQTGKSYTNTVTVVPGRGAQRKQDGAPPNATIYPFKAKYIVCKKYAKETARTQYESNFVCFKDKGGNWNCPVDGVPKITYLK